jgi:starvation-inducible DNA-binding protein
VYLGLPVPRNDNLERGRIESGPIGGWVMAKGTAKTAGKTTSKTIAKRAAKEPEVMDRARPLVGQKAMEIQPFGTIVKLPIALSETACRQSVENLNQVLADTITLRDLYKKHHWQVAGHTFYQLHLLFDKHYEEQNELVDQIAERIQLLGGVSLAMAPDIAETTIIPRPPRGREEVPVQISRLLHAHEILLEESRSMARQAEESDDDGTNDLLVSDVVRTNELQVWFLSQHLVDVPLVRAD